MPVHGSLFKCESGLRLRSSCSNFTSISPALENIFKRDFPLFKAKEYKCPNSSCTSLQRPVFGVWSWSSLIEDRLLTQLLLLLFCLFVILFETRFPLCIHGCPGTHSIDWAGLELRELPASASWLLELKAYAAAAAATTTRPIWGVLTSKWILQHRKVGKECFRVQYEAWKSALIKFVRNSFKKSCIAVKRWNAVLNAESMTKWELLPLEAYSNNSPQPFYKIETTLALNFAHLWFLFGSEMLNMNTYITSVFNSQKWYDQMHFEIPIEQTPS